MGPDGHCESRRKLIIASLVKEASNVVIRNLGVEKVLADNGDAIGVRGCFQLSPIPWKNLTLSRVLEQRLDRSL